MAGLFASPPEAGHTPCCTPALPAAGHAIRRLPASDWTAWPMDPAISICPAVAAPGRPRCSNTPFGVMVKSASKLAAPLRPPTSSPPTSRAPQPGQVLPVSPPLR